MSLLAGPQIFRLQVIAGPCRLHSWSYLRLGFPALDAEPNGVATGIGGALLLSALGFFFSRLPLGMSSPFFAGGSQQKTLDPMKDKVRSNKGTAAIAEQIFPHQGRQMMELSARYIVRKGRKGQYIITVAPPNWNHRDVPGFATEAAAAAWIASRPRETEQ